jgi:thymidine kinase
MSSLEIIMGPMFSGKTEMLIEIYNKEFNNIQTLSEIFQDNQEIIAFNYYKDTRYGDNIISSHNGKKIPSINIQTLSEIFQNDKFEKLTHIFINEAQFFPDLKITIIKLVEQHNKHVVICGLDSDYKREKFGQIWELIPYADKLTKLYGKCNNCDNKSLFTHRISCEKQQEVVGNNNYIPLCRSCYININKNVTITV